MKDNSIVLLTTFVYGEKYQAYIPLLIYSCKKAYPEYDIMLFVYGNLTPNIKEQVVSLQYTNIKIKENCFSDCPKMTPRVSQCLRWVLWDDSFINYDFIYVVDIDMLYIREPQPLHIQHEKHMQVYNLMFDNIRRKHKRNVTKMTTILQRFKYAKFRSWLKFFLGNKIEYRATGLHFIDAKKYYGVLRRKKLEYYKEKIYNKGGTRWAMYPNDEVLLYSILEREGLKPEKMAIQTDSMTSLDFNNPQRPEFRPHHGIHLGIFRKEIESLTESDKKILDSMTYRYYVNQYIDLYKSDKVFDHLISVSPSFIKTCFNKMHKYYGIK